MKRLTLFAINEVYFGKPVLFQLFIAVIKKKFKEIVDP